MIPTLLNEASTDTKDQLREASSSFVCWILENSQKEISPLNEQLPNSILPQEYYGALWQGFERFRRVPRENSLYIGLPSLSGESSGTAFFPKFRSINIGATGTASAYGSGIPESARDERALLILQERARVQKLQGYLISLIRTGDVEIENVPIFWGAWRDLALASSNKLPVPNAGVGPDGEILYTWDKGDHHFELEIFPDSHGEFFYLNRQTDEMWEYDYEVGDPIPEEVKDKLNLFLYD